MYVDEGGQKLNVVSTVCGPKIYNQIKHLVAPAQLKEKTFSELTELVKKHMNPARSVIVSRFRFNSKAWKPEE